MGASLPELNPLSGKFPLDLQDDPARRIDRRVRLAEERWNAGLGELIFSFIASAGHVSDNLVRRLRSMALRWLPSFQSESAGLGLDASLFLGEIDLPIRES